MNKDMKFSPEKLLARIGTCGNSVGFKAVYPHFIASKYDLEISVIKADGRYYISENGCVIKYLKETGGYTLLEKNIKKIRDAFGIALSADSLCGSYTDGYRGYFDFIKNLIFVINIGLVLPHFVCEVRYTDIRITGGDAVREDISGYGECVSLRSGEADGGFVVTSGIRYLNSESGTSSVFFSQNGDGSVCIEDGETHFGFRREVLDLAAESDGGTDAYGAVIRDICAYFGVEFQNEKISMKSKPHTEVLLNNYFRFLQAAVLLSEVGDLGLLCKK